MSNYFANYKSPNIVIIPNESFSEGPKKNTMCEQTQIPTPIYSKSIDKSQDNICDAVANEQGVPKNNHIIEPMSKMCDKVQENQFSVDEMQPVSNHIKVSEEECNKMVMKTLSWASNYLKSIGQTPPKNINQPSTTRSSRPILNQNSEKPMQAQDATLTTDISKDTVSTKQSDTKDSEPIISKNKHNTSQNSRAYEHNKYSDSRDKKRFVSQDKDIVNTKKYTNRTTSYRTTSQSNRNTNKYVNKCTDFRSYKKSSNGDSILQRNTKNKYKSISKLPKNNKDSEKAEKHYDGENIKSKVCKQSPIDKKNTPSKTNVQTENEGSSKIEKLNIKSNVNVSEQSHNKKVDLRARFESFMKHQIGEKPIETPTTKSDDKDGTVTKPVTSMKSVVQLPKKINHNATSQSQVSRDSEDLRNKLKRKHETNKTLKRDNLTITVQNERDNVKEHLMGKSDLSKTKHSTNKYKKIKLVINLVCDKCSDTSESDSDSPNNEYSLANMDLSFLDDFNVDDIVDCLNSPEAKTNRNIYESSKVFKATSETKVSLNSGINENITNDAKFVTRPCADSGVITNYINNYKDAVHVKDFRENEENKTFTNINPNIFMNDYGQTTKVKEDILHDMNRIKQEKNMNLMRLNESDSTKDSQHTVSDNKDIVKSPEQNNRFTARTSASSRVIPPYPLNSGLTTDSKPIELLDNLLVNIKNEPIVISDDSEDEMPAIIEDNKMQTNSIETKKIWSPEIAIRGSTNIQTHEKNFDVKSTKIIVNNVSSTPTMAIKPVTDTSSVCHSVSKHLHNENYEGNCEIKIINTIPNNTLSLSKTIEQLDVELDNENTEENCQIKDKNTILNNKLSSSKTVEMDNENTEENCEIKDKNTILNNKLSSSKSIDQLNDKMNNDNTKGNCEIKIINTIPIDELSLSNSIAQSDVEMDNVNYENIEGNSEIKVNNTISNNELSSSNTIGQLSVEIKNNTEGNCEINVNNTILNNVPSLSTNYEGNCAIKDNNKILNIESRSSKTIGQSDIEMTDDVQNNSATKEEEISVTNHSKEKCMKEMDNTIKKLESSLSKKEITNTEATCANKTVNKISDESKATIKEPVTKDKLVLNQTLNNEHSAVEKKASGLKCKSYVKKVMPNKNNKTRDSVVDKTGTHKNKKENIEKKSSKIKQNPVSLVQNTILRNFDIQFTINDLIRQGKFSNVYKGKDSKGGEYAVKILHETVNRIVPCWEKKAILKLLQKDSNCILFRHCSSIDGVWYFLMEYYPRHLNQAMSKIVGFELDQVQALSRQLIAAILALRNNNIVHLAIKPEHILLNSTNERLKLAGFDEAQDIRKVVTLPNFGTCNYRSPEIILGYPDVHKADVWGAALIMYKMWTNENMFKGCFNNVILFKQQCYFGKIPYDMLQLSVYKRLHFYGSVFVRTVEPGKTSMINTFNNRPRIGACIYQVYDNYWANQRTRKQKAQDSIKLQLFQNLLEEMLVIHPHDRMPIEFVYSHQFIYEPFDSSLW